MSQNTSRAKIGLGTKIVFTQSGSVGELTDTIDGFGWERTDFDATHFDVPTLDEVKTNRIKIPSGLSGIKDVTLSAHFDSALGFPRSNDPETIEIVFARRTTEATPAKFRAKGYIKDVNGTIPLDGKMMIRFTLGWTGDYEFIRPTLAS